jgi:hypothetical protein
MTSQLNVIHAAQRQADLHEAARRARRFRTNTPTTDREVRFPRRLSLRRRRLAVSPR